MFLQNKYTTWYYALMRKRRISPFDGYGEWHHEVPKSLGGSNAKSNLVRLTAREHFVAHRLLVRMTEGFAKRKMVFALHRTRTGGKFIPNSRTVEQIREMYAAQLRGKPRSKETRGKISEALKGFKMSQEAKDKISAAFKGKAKSDSFKQQMRERLNDSEKDSDRRAKISSSLKGHKLSEETRRKISETRKRKHAEGTLRTRWSG